MLAGTLAERLQAHGLSLTGVSSGSTGGVFLITRLRSSGREHVLAAAACQGRVAASRVVDASLHLPRRRPAVEKLEDRSSVRRVGNASRVGNADPLVWPSARRGPARHRRRPVGDGVSPTSLMRFGLFSVVDHYPRELRRGTGEFYGELLEQAEAADELGFDSFWVAEHHFHEYGAIPRPPVWMAAAAQRTRRLRLGSGVVVLPFDNPLRVAEDYAMVDVLSHGRLNLGVGSGYLRHEYAGFNVDPEERRERFDEALEVLLRAWTGERFSYAGRHHRVSEVELNVRPVQQPRPPIWIATLRADRAAHIGARGFPVMLIPYASAETVDEMAAGLAAYRAAFAGAGERPENGTVPFGFHCHCAETTAQARRQAREPMERYVRTRLYAVQRPFEALIEQDVVAFGDPDEIVRVARRYEAAGFTDFLGIANFGGLPHKQVLQSMELMARHVLPRFAP